MFSYFLHPLKRLPLILLGILASSSCVCAQSLIWAKNFGGPGNQSMGYSIKSDGTGNTYTTGYFQGTADFDPGPGTYNLTSYAGTFDIFVCKLDASGKLVWVKQFGSTVGNDVGRFLTLDAAGNVYITGSFFGTIDFDPGPGTSNLASVGNGDIFITKLDAAGNFLLAKSMGGLHSDYANSIAIDKSGNIYTTGLYSNTADFDPGPGIYNLSSTMFFDIFISKLDATGNFVWAKRMGSMDGDVGYSIALDGAGNVYTTGYFIGTVDFDPGANIYTLTSAGSSLALFISKLDASGNFLWANKIDGCIGESIVIDISGNIYVGGDFTGTRDFDPGPGILNLVSTGSSDAFISKFDASGNFLWANKTGGKEYDRLRELATDNFGNIYLTGLFSSTVDFDPGAGTYNLTSNNGIYEIYVAKFNSSGDFLWAGQMGGITDDAGWSLAVDHNGYIYSTGYYTGTADFDPTSTIYSLKSAGKQDIFITKICPTSPRILTAPVVAVNQPTCAVSSGMITITSPTDPEYTYSIDGILYQSNLTIGALAPGTYNITVKSFYGCVPRISTATSITIHPASLPSSPATQITQPTCAITTGIITVSSPIGNEYSYTIDGISFQFSPIFNNLIPGNYNVVAKNGNCTSSATAIKINNSPGPLPTPIISVIQPTCSIPKGTVTVSDPIGNNYTYSIDGISYQPSNIFNGLISGIYNVTVKDVSGCIATTSITLDKSPGFSLNLTASPNVVLAGKNVYAQSSASVPYQIISWEPSNLFPIQNSKIQNFSTDTSLTLRVIGKGTSNCIDTAYFNLTVIPLDYIYIPSSFTPNGDGTNDFFKIFGSKIKELDLKIFNRFGQIVFATREKDKGWDGRYKGVLQNGVFVYFIKAILKDGTVTNKKGNVVLTQ